MDSWKPSNPAAIIQQWKLQLGLREPRDYRAGAELFSAGAHPDQYVLVVEGVVGLYCFMPGEEESLFAVSCSGDLVSSSTSDSAAGMSAAMLSSGRAYRIDGTRLREAALKSPDFAALWQQATEVQLGQRAAALVELLVLAPAQRLAARV